MICGFGRLGHWFGSERFDVRPDLMSVAKGLTSGYVPMSAVLLSEPVWEVLRAGSAEHGPFNHGFTYSGHPVAAAAALANLDVLERERLVERAGVRGAYLQRRLRERFGDDPRVAEVRGTGLIAALDLGAPGADPELPYRLVARAREQGLITRAVAGGVALAPPLVIDEAEIDELLARLERSFAAL